MSEKNRFTYKGVPGQPAPKGTRKLKSRDQLSAMKAIRDCEKLGDKEKKRMKQRALELGLEAAPSVTDRNISLFVRDIYPHFAGINTFLKLPYCEDINKVGEYDVAFVGAPIDWGTTNRPGTRFGPQGVRRASAGFDSFSPDMCVDLREQLKMCDVGDIFVIPSNLEKSFDQIDMAVSHIHKHGVFPVICGGDHSIGFPCVRGIAQCTSKRIGIVHFDRHIDIQERDLDERMHTTPWFHATDLPNVPAVNLVQVGIGGWQVPREGVRVARERNTNILTMRDVEELGLDKTAEIALELAWKGADAVYISFDIDSVDCGFVPGTGWPEPGGFLPREALALVGKVAAEGICGLEVVEVSPPYDTSDITALLATRVIVDVLGSMVSAGKLGSHRGIIDKPQTIRFEVQRAMPRTHGKPIEWSPPIMIGSAPDEKMWLTARLI